MLSLNAIVISGRVTQDPEIHTVGSSEKKLAKFGIANNKEYMAKGGRKTDTVFIDVQVWEKSADFVEKYLRKGDFCVVEGEMVMERWKSKLGEFRSKLCIRCKSIQKVRLASKDETDDDQPDGNGSSGGVGGEYAPAEQGHKYSAEDCPAYRSSNPPQKESATNDALYDNDVPPF